MIFTQWEVLSSNNMQYDVIEVVLFIHQAVTQRVCYRTRCIHRLFMSLIWHFLFRNSSPCENATELGRPSLLYKCYFVLLCRHWWFCEPAANGCVVCKNLWCLHNATWHLFVMTTLILRKEGLHQDGRIEKMHWSMQWSCFITNATSTMVLIMTVMVTVITSKQLRSFGGLFCQLTCNSIEIPTVAAL